MRGRERLVVGLTGGIGAGKSSALAAFKRLGAKTVALDEIANEVVRPGRCAYQDILGAFGAGVLDPQGRIDRARLARLVFDRPARLRRLEAITHPIILREMRRRIRRARGVVIVDVPLLFEGAHEGEFDLTMLISTPATIRLRRLISRGMSRALALRRMRAQLTDRVKAPRADIVLPNAGRREEFSRRLESYYDAFALMQQSPV